MVKRNVALMWAFRRARPTPHFVTRERARKRGCRPPNPVLVAPPRHGTPVDERQSGRSSGVEHNLAKVGVEGSNPFARSSSLLLISGANQQDRSEPAGGGKATDRRRGSVAALSDPC